MKNIIKSLILVYIHLSLFWVMSCGNAGGGIESGENYVECKICGEWQSTNGVTKLSIYPNYAEIKIQMGEVKCNGIYHKLSTFGEDRGKFIANNINITCSNGQQKIIDELVVNYHLDNYTLTLDAGGENETIYTRNFKKIPNGSEFLIGKWVDFSPEYFVKKDIERFEIVFTKDRLFQNGIEYEVMKYIAENDRILVILNSKELLIYEILDRDKIKHRLAKNVSIILVRTLD